MKMMAFILTLGIVFFQQQFILQIQARDVCQYYTSTGNISTIYCADECCTAMSQSIQTACCTSVSFSTLAIPFFVIMGVCILGICVIYCRPLWKMCLCGHRCPFGNRTQVSSPRSVPANENPIFILNNDDLPDYETISKDTGMKDSTPPPYNFVATHPNEFNANAQAPSAPPQYSSRPGSAVLTHPTPSNTF